MTAELTSPERIWDEGDFRRLSGGVVLVSELLCEAVELHALEKVLDVGCGNGNTSIAAAHRRATVIGVDASEKLLEHGRRRAEVEQVKIDFRTDNAEHLHFPDGSFDVVMSTFGVSFAGNAEAAARQLVRVCRPGGRIGLANWTGNGFTGQLFELVGKPIRDGGLSFDPLRWGEPNRLAEMFGSEVKTVKSERLQRRFRADSVEAFVGGLERFLPPVASAMKFLDGDGQAELRERVAELVKRHNTAHDGTVLGSSEYLEFVGERRSSR